MEGLSFCTGNEGENGPFLYGGRFQKQISKKKYTDFRKPTHGLWKIDLLLTRIC